MVFVVLNSGGVDSAALLELIDRRSKRSRDDYSVFIDYGQRAATHERYYSSALARWYGYTPVCLTLDVPSWRKSSPLKPNYFSFLDEPCVVLGGTSKKKPEDDGGWQVPNRNIVLLSVVAAEIRKRVPNDPNLELQAAFRDSAGAPDQTLEFMGDAAKILLYGGWETVALSSDVLHMKKSEIIETHWNSSIMRKKGYSAWSCENDLKKHCGVCRNCVEIRETPLGSQLNIFLSEAPLKKFSGLDIKYVPQS